MSRRKKTYCEWCGHEITRNGADVPHIEIDDNDVPHILCATCFFSDPEAQREMIDAFNMANIEFYGEYPEDDF